MQLGPSRKCPCQDGELIPVRKALQIVHCIGRRVWGGAPLCGEGSPGDFSPVGFWLRCCWSTWRASCTLVGGAQSVTSDDNDCGDLDGDLAVCRAQCHMLSIHRRI